MLISKFPAASAVEFLVLPCAFAHTEPRLPEVGVIGPRAGAQGYTRLSPPPEQNGCALHELAALGVVIPKEMLARASALPLNAISCASSPHCSTSPLPRLRTALRCQSLME